MKVSYFLITRDRIDDLCDCLDHLRAQTYRPLEIVLLDNASSDGTASRVIRDYPEVKLIVLDRNLGVTGGRNRAMHACKGDLLIGLDDDAIIEDPEFTRKVVGEFLADPELGCLSPRIVNYRTGLQDPKEIPARDKSKRDKRFETSYFIGCAFAIPRAVLERTGDFPEGFFYGQEEVDLGIRIHRSGYRLVYEPSLVVRHKVSPFRGTSRTKHRYYVRNRIWYAVTYYPVRYLLVYLGAWLPFLFLRAFQERASLEFFIGLGEGLRGLRPYRVLRTLMRLDKEAIRRLKRVENRLLY